MTPFFDQWFHWMISSSVQLGILVVLIALVAAVGRKLSARFRYTLWALILLKALLPPFFTTPLAIAPHVWSESVSPAPIVSPVSPVSPGASSGPLTPHVPPEIESAEMPDEILVGESPIFSTDETPAFQENTVIAASSPEQAPGLTAAAEAISVSKLLFAVWLCGVTTYFALVLYYYGWAMGLLEKGKKLENGPIFDLLQRLGKRLKLRHVPQIVLSDSVRSPFLWGLFRGKIALPADFPGEVSPREMESVLLHELMHWRRLDMFVARLELLVRGVFWFHPLVLFSLWNLRRERESACDEAVLESGCVGAKEYGDSLLSVLNVTREKSMVPVGFLGFLGILERSSQTHKRLEEIMSQNNSVKRMGIVGWTVIAAFILCVLPMAAAQKEEKKETEKEQEAAVQKTEAPQAEPLANAPVPEKDPANFEQISKAFLERMRLGAGMKYLSHDEIQNRFPDIAKVYPGGGYLVEKVYTGSQFDKLNVRPGDVIAKIDRWKMDSETSLSDFNQHQYEQDTTITVELYRGNEYYFVDVPIKATIKPSDGGFETPGPSGIGGFTYLVYFKPKEDFNPRNPMGFLNEFREDLLKRGPITGYFRTKPEDGKLLGSLATADPAELEEFFKTTPRIEFVKSVRLTKEMFEEYENTKQESLPPADGGYATPQGFTHVVKIGGKGDFVPKTKTQFSKAISELFRNKNIGFGVVRSQVDDGKLVLLELTDDPEGMKKVLDESDTMQFLESKRLTQMYYNLYFMDYRDSHFLPPEDGGFSWHGHRYIVTIKPKGDSPAKTEQELIDEINKISPWAYAGKFRFDHDEDGITCDIMTDDAETLKETFDKSSSIEFVKAERLTKKLFDQYDQRPNTAKDGGFATPGHTGVGGFTHIVYFVPKGDFNPKTPGQFLAEFREDLFLKNAPITGYFRTKPEDGKLLGSLLTGEPEKLEEFFKSTPRIEFVKSVRLTKEMFQEYEKTKQLSLDADEVEKQMKIIRQTDWFKKLSDMQKNYTAWDEDTFSYDYDPKLFELGDKKAETEKQWIALLQGKEPVRYSQDYGKATPYGTAILGGALHKCEGARELLVKIACEKIVKDNSYRHVATKALGLLGDPAAIPDLIPLVYHFNLNVRFAAQISLVQLTGENFGRDWKAWGEWYNANRTKLGKDLPAFDPTPVDWTFGSDNAELKYYADPANQEKVEEEFLGLRKRETPTASPTAKASLEKIEQSDWYKKLTPGQRKYVQWDENQFAYVYDPKNYEVGNKRVEFEEKWVKLLEGPEPGYPGGKLTPYDEAIFGLATIKSDKAAKQLVKIAAEKVLKDNAHRHFATKALGILGDPSVIPDLIPLVYHFNMNTRWDAQVALVRLTGENFGVDAKAWGEWYNANRGKLGKDLPEFDFTPVDWTCGSNDPELKKWADPEVQKEMDERY